MTTKVFIGLSWLGFGISEPPPEDCGVGQRPEIKPRLTENNFPSEWR